MVKGTAPSTQEAVRVAVLVLGMHRSGTSALTRILNLAGVELGSKLLSASGDNAAGFWEHRDIVLVHERLLASLGASWDDTTPISAERLRSEEVRPFREELLAILRRDFWETKRWGLKDPRLCRLLPLWLEILREFGSDPRFVLICRDPREVAASLARRNGFSEAKSHLLWLDHCLSAERASRDHRRVFVTYEQLLSDWRWSIEHVLRGLGLSDVDMMEMAEGVEAFLDPTLRHHHSDHAATHRWVDVTYEAFRQASTHTSPEIERLLDVIAERVDAASQLFSPVLGEQRLQLESLKPALQERDAKIAQLRARVEELTRKASEATAARPAVESARRDSRILAGPRAEPRATPGRAPRAPEPVALPNVTAAPRQPGTPGPAAESEHELHPVIQAFSEASATLEGGSASASPEVLRAPGAGAVSVSAGKTGLSRSRGSANLTRTYATPEGQPRVSIVISLFNDVEHTEKCVASIVENTPDGLYEVIFVDNASSDGTAKFLACLEGNVKVVSNDRNMGFSNACNLGAEVAATGLLLFLSNGVEPRPGWLEPLLEVIETDPEVAIVGSKLVFPDGTIQHAGVALLSNPAGEVPLRAFHVHYGKPADSPEANVATEMQVVTGACLLIRKAAFDEAGGFDPFYWNGCEDIDLCLRVGMKGGKIVYQPRSVLLHDESEKGPERSSSVRGNEKLLCSRWLEKVEPDLVASPGGTGEIAMGKRIRPWRLAGRTQQGAKAASTPGELVNLPGQRLVSIVIVTRNGLALTRECFESLRLHTPEPHEVIFVDNGSTDGTPEYLRNVVRAYEHVKVIARSKNTGFAAGNNQGLSLASGRFVVLLNNDTVVTEGWLSGLVNVLDEFADVGLVGPMTNYVSGPQLVSEASYGSLAEMEAFATRWKRNNSGVSEPARRLVGFCLLVHRVVIDKIGGLDERFGTGNCEDDDFCLRAFQAGFRARIAREVFIHHVGGQTFRAEGIDYAHSMRANFEVFKEKWRLDASWTLEKGYPFMELVQGTPQARIELPELAAHYHSEMGGRWLQDGKTPEVRSKENDHRLKVGVLPGKKLIPELVNLFERHGHSGEIPYWGKTSDLEFQLRDPGLVLLLGPDVIVLDDALKELVAVAAENPTIAAVGPVSNAAPSAQRLDPAYRDLNRSLHRFVSKRRRRHRGEWTEVPHLGAFCLMLRSELVTRLGGLRTELSLPDALFELFAAIRQAGLNVACATGAYVHHSFLTEEEGSLYDERSASEPPVGSALRARTAAPGKRSD
jgi:GT2 family glycosyltransferase